MPLWRAQAKLYLRLFSNYAIPNLLCGSYVDRIHNIDIAISMLRYRYVYLIDGDIVLGLVTKLHAGRSGGLESLQGKLFFLVSEMSRPCMRPTQLHAWVKSVGA
jgi:hypothetical protein